MAESPTTVTYKDSFELNKEIFKNATLIAFGSFVLLVAFLGSVWDDKVASKATLDSVFMIAVSLLPVSLLFFLVAWQGGVDRRSADWVENLNRTLPVWAITSLAYVAFAMAKWLLAINSIVEATHPATG
jgi:hypothetical protein